MLSPESEDIRINNTLKSFEYPASSSSVKHDLVKKISGKKAQSVIFIEGENRLKCWETHFKNLLNSEPQTQTAPDPIQKIETNEKRQSPRLRWPISRILETTED